MSLHKQLQLKGFFSPRGVNNGNGKKPIYDLKDDRSELIGWMDAPQAWSFLKQQAIRS